MWNLFRVNNEDNDAVLVSLLLTLNRFHTLFWFFHCWLWLNKCRLGCLFWFASYPIFLSNYCSCIVKKVQVKFSKDSRKELCCLNQLTSMIQELTIGTQGKCLYLIYPYCVILWPVGFIFRITCTNCVIVYWLCCR